MADLLIAGATILLLFTVFCLTALAVFLGDGGPVFFAQERIGRNGRTFRCLKFRTMQLDADKRLAELLATDAEARRCWQQEHKLRKDPRVTAVGSFLRKSSLDELPQLLNVLRGEMSIVGPRPIVPAEISRYGRYFHDYCSVRPGLTGLWQISGRNDTTYRRRVAYDVIYARKHGFLLYVAVLFGTVPAVLLRRGAY